MKILIEDDERPICNSLKEILMDEGYEVETAEDSPAALAKGKKEYDKRQTIKEKDIRREMDRGGD